MNLIIESIARQAELNPDAIAVSTKGVNISYAKFTMMVDHLAEQLSDRGLTSICLLADNNLAWILTDLACLKAGICCIPLPVFFTATQINHICRITNTRVIVGDRSVCLMDTEDPEPDNIDAKRIDNLETIVVDDEHKISIFIASRCNFLQQHDNSQQKQHTTSCNPENIAKITFTSGSTGKPKGVCLTRENIENTVKALNTAIKPGTSQRHLSVLPMVTLLENIAGIYLPLIQGATLILRPMQEIGFTDLAQLDYNRFFSTLNEVRPESIILVPELLRVLVEGIQQRLVDPDNFRLIAVGGGSINLKLLKQAEQQKLPVVQGYGLSECCSVVSLNTPTQNRIGSVGKPLEHIEVKIADDGEIMVVGNTMSGYMETTNTNQIGEHRQWFATGDIGAIDDDGYLYITGRKKNLIISSYGKNISPEWLENLFQGSELVHQVAIIGDANTSIQAIVVPSQIALSATDTRAQINTLVNEINKTLPKYAQITQCKLAPEPFKVENGMLTANGRMKRNAIAAFFTRTLNYPANKGKDTFMTFYDELTTRTAENRDTMYRNIVFKAVEKGTFTADSYTYFLTQAYHHVKHTVPLLMQCGASLPAEFEWLRKAMVEYIEEEYGHDEWILNDLEALGIARVQASQSTPDENIELMVAYLYDAINRDHPVALLGMVFMLESTSTQVATGMANKIRDQLSIEDNAFSYLLSHGELDLKHIEFFKQLVNRINNRELQEKIIKSANMCYRLYTKMLTNIPGLKPEQGGKQHEAA